MHVVFLIKSTEAELYLKKADTMLEALYNFFISVNGSASTHWWVCGFQLQGTLVQQLFTN
jgi:hypothetical protein